MIWFGLKAITITGVQPSFLPFSWHLKVFLALPLNTRFWKGSTSQWSVWVSSWLQPRPQSCNKKNKAIKANYWLHLSSRFLSNCSNTSGNPGKRDGWLAIYSISWDYLPGGGFCFLSVFVQDGMFLLSFSSTAFPNSWIKYNFRREKGHGNSALVL